MCDIHDIAYSKSPSGNITFFLQVYDNGLHVTKMAFEEIIDKKPASFELDDIEAFSIEVKKDRAQSRGHNSVATNMNPEESNGESHEQSWEINASGFDASLEGNGGESSEKSRKESNETSHELPCTDASHEGSRVEKSGGPIESEESFDATLKSTALDSAANLEESREESSKLEVAANMTPEESNGESHEQSWDNSSGLDASLEKSGGSIASKESLNAAIPKTVASGYGTNFEESSVPIASEERFDATPKLVPLSSGTNFEGSSGPIASEQRLDATPKLVPLSSGTNFEESNDSIASEERLDATPKLVALGSSANLEESSEESSKLDAQGPDASRKESENTNCKECIEPPEPWFDHIKQLQTRKRTLQCNMDTKQGKLQKAREELEHAELVVANIKVAIEAFETELTGENAKIGKTADDLQRYLTTQRKIFEDGLRKLQILTAE